MTSMNLDASLDDMIKSAPRNKKGGRGGGAKRSSGGGGGDGGNNNIPKPRVGRGGGGAGGVRAKVIAKPRRGPSGGRSVVAAMDTWEHDMYQGGGRAGGRGVAERIGGGASVGGGSAKLIISNLHYNVSNQDVKELFEQVGAVKKSGVNFDEQGRSKGSAEVIFARRQDALQAIKTYNESGVTLLDGVKLDGKPLQIELVGGVGAPGAGMTLSSGITVSAGARNGPGGARTVTFQAPTGGAGIGGGRKKVIAKVVRLPAAKVGGAGGRGEGQKSGRGGRGGRGPRPAKAKPLTQEELDAQLESYKMQE